MFVPTKVTLASNSPRRKKLLNLTGWTVIASPADIDETPQPGETAKSFARRMAKEKAFACKTSTSSFILAGDTVVVDDNLLLGKPNDKQDARQMLSKLRGRIHQVITAVFLLNSENGNFEEEMCVSQVPVRAYSDNEMDDYITTGDPLDKAGAYAIQHAGFHPVENFTGCFASVMGLPLCHIKRMSERMGLAVSETLPGDCQKLNHYTCKIFSEIARGEEIG